MRRSKNQSTFRQSMERSLGALGQTESLYTVLPGGAGCASGQGYVDPSREAKKKYSGAENVPYSYIAQLFGDQNIELGDPDSWYIGGGSNTPGRCASIESDLWGYGFSLARANGVVPVPKWIYRTGMSESTIASAAAKSSAEESRGLVKTCSTRFPSTTPTQASAIVNDSERLRGLPPWEVDCLRAWSTQTAPAGGGRFDAVAAAAAAAAKKLTEPTENVPTTYACRAGYQRPPAGKHITCLPGYGIDVDGSGCEACVAACSPGWSAPDKVSSSECPPGEMFQVDPRTRCVRCTRLANCWTAGMNPVPCPAPYVVQQRGAYSCCVSPSQAGGGGGGQSVAPPQAPTGPVPASPPSTMTADIGGISKGWLLAGAAVVAALVLGGSKSSPRSE